MKRYFVVLLAVSVTLGRALYGGNGNNENGASSDAKEEAAAAAERVQAEYADDDRISLTVAEASLQDVLRSLAAMRPEVNIIMGSDVEGEVGLLTLNDVRWETALHLVADANNLEVSREGDNIYRVHRKVVRPDKDVDIQLMTPADADVLSEREVRRLIGEGAEAAELDLTAMREHLARHADDYLLSLSVESAPAIDVVSALARKGRLNFAFAPGMRKAAQPDQDQPADAPLETSVTLNLGPMEVESALRLVANQGGMTANKQDGVWVIAPMSEEKRAAEPLVLETFQVDYLPLDESLLEVLRTLVSERGKVTAGKSKVLIVRDTADGIETVRRALQVMDIPTPQVLIEARFFELQNGSSKNIGVDWNALGKEGVAVNVDPLTYSRNKVVTDSETRQGRTGASSTTQTETVTRNLATGAVTGTVETVTETNSGTPGTTSNIEEEVINTARSAILDMSQFGVVLHALKEDLDAKQLSNPKVVVSSDEQASIHIGDQTPIVKSTVESTEGGDVIRTFELDPDYGGQTRTVESLTGDDDEPRATYKTRKGYLDLGTKLTVAPSVKTQEQIFVRVVPELTSLLGFETFGSGENQVRYPLLFVTKVRTQFTIRSGQTIAIGGLVNERTNTDVSRVPVLGSLPLLGKVFSYESEEVDKTETIIFLTVKVIAPEQMNVASGIPVRAYMVQPEVKRIEKEDAAGAVYLPERAKEKLERIREEAESKRWNPKKMTEAIRDKLGKGEGNATAEDADADVSSTASADQQTNGVAQARPAVDANSRQTTMGAAAVRSLREQSLEKAMSETANDAE